MSWFNKINTMRFGTDTFRGVQQLNNTFVDDYIDDPKGGSTNYYKATNAFKQINTMRFGMDTFEGIQVIAPAEETETYQDSINGGNDNYYKVSGSFKQINTMRFGTASFEGVQSIPPKTQVISDEPDDDVTGGSARYYKQTTDLTYINTMRFGTAPFGFTNEDTIVFSENNPFLVVKKNNSTQIKIPFISSKITTPSLALRYNDKDWYIPMYNDSVSVESGITKQKIKIRYNNTTYALGQMTPT